MGREGVQRGHYLQQQGGARAGQRGDEDGSVDLDLGEAGSVDAVLEVCQRLLELDGREGKTVQDAVEPGVAILPTHGRGSRAGRQRRYASQTAHAARNTTVVTVMASHPSRSAVTSSKLARPNRCMAASSRMGGAEDGGGAKCDQERASEEEERMALYELLFLQVVQGRIGDYARRPHHAILAASRTAGYNPESLMATAKTATARAAARIVTRPGSCRSSSGSGVSV